MTPTNAPEPIEIKPRPAPLAHSRARSKLSTLPSTRSLGITIAAALGVGLLTWVFLFLPGNVGETAVTVVTPDNPDGTSSSPTPDTVALPPFAQRQREKAREQAQASLSRFVDTQLELEAMNVESWGAEAFAAARRLATEGDEDFLRDRFDEAILAYGAGADALAALKVDGEQRLSGALDAAIAALNARNVDGAEKALAEARIYAADDPDVLDGQRRLEVLPEVIALERKARRFEQRSQPADALQAWRQAAALDPALDGAGSRISTLQAQLSNSEFNNRLSSGFAALNAGRYDDASRAFDSAAALRPGDPAVIGARQQLSEATVLSDLDRIRRQANAAMASESFSDAQSLYARALAIDPTLAFARDGEDDAKRLAANADRLSELLADPLVLSDDTTLAEAGALASGTLARDASHASLAAKARELAALVRDYQQPVTLTLTSDAATAVTIFRVGELGTFSSRDVELRPGRYTIVGIRNGCRDVRAEVVVLPGMEPVDIRCREPI